MFKQFAPKDIFNTIFAEICVVLKQCWLSLDKFLKYLHKETMHLILVELYNCNDSECGSLS